MSSRIFYTSLLFILSVGNVVDPLIQDVYWRDYVPREIPYDAIEGAPGRYIGQILNDGFMVAHIYPDTDTAVYVYYKRKTTKSNIKILCSRKQDKLYWEEVNFTQPHSKQMKDAIKGGYVVSWDTHLYIGKTHYEGEWKIGIVFEIGHPKWGGLWVWDAEGVEVQFTQFYMLKYNSTAAESEDVCDCGCGPVAHNVTI